jgi:beta-glucosidase
VILTTGGKVPREGHDITVLVAEMTIEEKTRLTAGEDLWSTPAVERLGIPKVRVTDGPNGARGPALPGGSVLRSACVPCGSALGATWNLDLVEQVGVVLGQETRSKASRVLLAPTVNIHRSPLAGRNFECYSEDPVLSGGLAAAFVHGAQSQGVATTVKHYAGNEAELERYTMSSVIDERALREIYLVPFEMAVRDGGSLAVMTAYNRLNGVYCAEHHELITEILREEWGFEGLVMTDWYAVGSTVGSARAGLDLEMPGPPRFFGPALAEAMARGEVDEAAVDAQMARILSVWDRIGALDDTGAEEPTSSDLAEHRSIARDAAAEAMVLLRNDGLLPLDVASLPSMAVIGPNAATVQMMGGGSASLTPHYETAPLEALSTRMGTAETITYEPGVDILRFVPPVEADRLSRVDGRQGFEVELFGPGGPTGEVLHRTERADGHLLFMGRPSPEMPEGGYWFRAVSRYTPEDNGPHDLTLVQLGQARLIVGGRVLLDGTVDPPARGRTFFGLGSEQIRARVDLRSGEAVELVVECACPDPESLTGAVVGCRRSPPDDLMVRAERAAAAADVAVVVVGTTREWESEGSDRSSLDLPGNQDELVERVIAANPNTVVVLNTGAPVRAPWADRARGLLQMWFGGQEMSPALAEVLVGDREPAGRLPMTWPLRLSDNPSFGNFPGEHFEVRYGESLLVGYRWYDARLLPTRFPFGHGLSYTSFEVSPPRLSSSVVEPGSRLDVSVDVTNTGRRRGAEVVQCYVSERAPKVLRPPKELKAFTKVWLDAGEKRTVTLHLDERAFAYWDPGTTKGPDLEQVARSSQFAPPPEPWRPPGWRIDAGTFNVHIARSAADLVHSVSVEVKSRQVDGRTG